MASEPDSSLQDSSSSEDERLVIMQEVCVVVVGAFLGTQTVTQRALLLAD